MSGGAAIETSYAGCRFRSRLEARWAVFFDQLKIEWEYEPQGYMIGDPYDESTPYLPDFYLPAVNIWIEVKGSEDALDRYLLVRAVDDWSNDPLPGLSGTAAGYEGGLLVLGSVPDVSKPPASTARPGHTLLTHYKGVDHGTVAFLSNGRVLREVKLPGCGMDVTTGPEGCARNCACPWTRSVWVATTSQDVPARDLQCVLDAYRGARSARFEFGESGAPARTRKRARGKTR